MTLYLVTSQAQEKNSVGTILSVKVRTFGVFTDETHADAIAEKYNANVFTLIADKEVEGSVIETWINPGYVS